MKNQLKLCKVCGQQIAENAKFCPRCGAKNKKPVFTKWWFWFLVIALVSGIIGASQDGDSSANNTNSETETSQTQTETEKESAVVAAPSVFDGDCGIAASAEIGNNIIGYPEITISITNTTDKEIAAIQFYAVPFDVYGEEIKGWTTENRLATDTSIAAGASTRVQRQLIEDSVKSIDLYVYSVYFSDGTEWGNKDATASRILAEAPEIEVFVTD